MPVDMTPVKSSSLKEVGHDADTGLLVVRFANGGTYHYSGVSKEAYDALMGAESVGKHFATHIRSQFEGKRV